MVVTATSQSPQVALEVVLAGSTGMDEVVDHCSHSAQVEELALVVDLGSTDLVDVVLEDHSSHSAQVAEVVVEDLVIGSTGTDLVEVVDNSSQSAQVVDAVATSSTI